MESINIMIKEHENIRRMLKVIRKISYRVLTNNTYDINDFSRIIDFVRSYADQLHHGKEEDILFTTMDKELEKLSKSGAIKGMYIEHDLGRLYMANLEKAIDNYKQGDDTARLDIIANGISYSDLLDRHIEKENTALYKFAEKMLSDNSKKQVDEDCKAVEDEALKLGIQEKYINLIEEFENKYE